MGSSLPMFVVLKSKYNSKYLEYVKEQGRVHGYVRFSGEDVHSPLSKFQVERAGSDSKLVHLRCCYNNKYLVASTRASHWIVSEADKPEKDQSKSSCTLFQPIPFEGDYRFKHVNSGKYAVLMRMGNEHPKNNCLSPRLPDPNSDMSDVYTVIDWKTLLVLPRYIGLTGDGGYLRAQLIDRHHYLQFAPSDNGDETVAHEVFPNPDGSIRLKSTYFGLFWRGSPDWIWADSDDTSTNNKDALFWPVKLNDNTIALRNLGNGKFCKMFTSDGKTLCLSAVSKTIDMYSGIHVIGLDISRNIYNVEFHLARARKYNEQVVSIGSGAAANVTNMEGSLDVRVERTESKSTSFSAGVSLKSGVKTTFVTTVPLIVDGQIEVPPHVKGSHQWGEVETITNTINVVYNALVPPMTSVTVSAIGTIATCDVPFSYTITDTFMDGTQRTYDMDDGTFTGINTFNISYEIKHEDIHV